MMVSVVTVIALIVVVMYDVNSKDLVLAENKVVVGNFIRSKEVEVQEL